MINYHHGLDLGVISCRTTLGVFSPALRHGHASDSSSHRSRRAARADATVGIREAAGGINIVLAGRPS